MSIERRLRVNPERFRGQIPDLVRKHSCPRITRINRIHFDYRRRIGVQRTARPTYPMRLLFVGRARHSVRAGREISARVRKRIATEKVMTLRKRADKARLLKRPRST